MSVNTFHFVAVKFHNFEWLHEALLSSPEAAYFSIKNEHNSNAST